MEDGERCDCDIEEKQKNGESPSPTSAEDPVLKALTISGRSAYARLCCLILIGLYPTKPERNWIRSITCELLKNIAPDNKDLHSYIAERIDNCEEYDNIESEIESAVSILILELGERANWVVTILKDLIVFSLRTGVYDARTRMLAVRVAEELNASLDDIVDVEDELVVELSAKKTEEELAEEEIRKKEEKRRKLKRNLLIGFGAVAGATILGLTGGLAAPLIAAGAGTLLGGGAAAVLAGVQGLAIITSLFGAAGAGLTGYKMKRRLGEIEQFEFEKLTDGDHLHLTIAISGWLEEPDQDDEEEMPETDEEKGFKEPWRTMRLSRERYCLKWEPKYLREVGSGITSLVTSGAISLATQEALKFTILQGIMSAIAWPMSVLKLGYLIDNPWGVCARRAAEVGKQLARVLVEREQGCRPVSLIGFSFGARVIFHCLKALAKMKGGEGLVQDAILLGAPVTADIGDWSAFEKVVAGRIVNGYCKYDWLLKFAYRTAAAQMTIAGLQPVKWENRRMVNIDLSAVVNSHGDYAKPEIMSRILSTIEKTQPGVGVVQDRQRTHDPRDKEAQEEERS